jgi:hypothetical protein
MPEDPNRSPRLCVAPDPGHVVIYLPLTFGGWP